MSALYDIIGVATDIVDMSIPQLTAQPKVCESLVQRVQNIGKAWDDHPDWHGRNWYVQVLLAVASLSRVVEWWEAEKQFWNFDDNDDELDEPLTFVTKPADEPDSVPTASVGSHDRDVASLRLDADDENKLRLTRPTSQDRRSRNEQPKELSASDPQRDVAHSRTPSKIVDNTESARVLATERLRLQAETAQNQNIVIELSLDGDHFLWINYAWRVVVGLVIYISILAQYTHHNSLLGLIQRNSQELEYHDCSLPKTGAFSGMLLNVYKKMTPILSRSDSSFGWNQMTSATYRLAYFTSRWRAKGC